MPLESSFGSRFEIVKAPTCTRRRTVEATRGNEIVTVAFMV